MNTIYVSNARRGCGVLVPGAVYGISQMVAGGTLAPWTWLLAQPWEDRLHMIWCDGYIPARTQVEINPKATLLECEIIPFEDNSGWTHQSDVACEVPEYGVADHVGKCFYTPWEFALECMTLGTSRRLARPVARKLAKQTPFPIFFSHSDIPLFENFDQAYAVFLRALETQTNGGPQASWCPTWYEDDFGLEVSDYNGDKHAMVDVLGYLSKEAAENKKRKVRYNIIANYEEAVFGASWITDVVQIVGEDEEVEESLAAAGVQKGVLENDDFDLL